MNKYRIIIFKEFHLIPETFIITSTDYLEAIREKINESLNGNALCLTDIKNKVRFYDRNVITKIFIKTIGE